MTARIIFGIIVMVSGMDKLEPGAALRYAGMVPSGPGIWYAFWSSVAMANPVVFTSIIAGVEITLGIAVLSGFLRRIFYLTGIVLGLFLWLVPEGVTGMQTLHGISVSGGLFYVVGLLLLISLETVYGPDRFTIDYYLIRQWAGWARLSSFVGSLEPLPPPEYMVAFAPVLHRLSKAEKKVASEPRRERPR
ncbi:MAG: DoxX family membrane protein [Candidatus Thermoplasmatota archaeon]|nr:DoxX family membrane protein [Candidatus Thermoplasmatota archaeon]MCL5984258.1 DoxX family membrane protein [Candidatus Thermoplasmatota archaeon]